MEALKELFADPAFHIFLWVLGVLLVAALLAYFIVRGRRYAEVRRRLLGEVARTRGEDKAYYERRLKRLWRIFLP